MQSRVWGMINLLGRMIFRCYFIKSVGALFKRDLMEVFVEFFENGVIYKWVNATFLVLFPKKSNVKELTDDRSISLVGSLYKVIANVLSIRLREVIATVVLNSECFCNG